MFLVVVNGTYGVVYLVYRSIQQRIGNGESIIEVHVYPLSVCSYPNNILIFVLHQAEDAGMDFRILHLVFYFLIGHIFQYDQSAAFEANVIVVLLFDDGRNFSASFDFCFEICNKVLLLIAEVIFIE